MLLSNMSKLESVSRQLLDLRLSFAVPAEGDSVADGTTEELEALDVLLEVFLKGEGKKYNPNANYDFLASVFANVSTVSSLAPEVTSSADPSCSTSQKIPIGRAFLLATPSPDMEPPLAKLISFTEHPSTIRRGGVASSIKCVPSSFILLHPHLSLQKLCVRASSARPPCCRRQRRRRHYRCDRPPPSDAPPSLRSRGVRHRRSPFIRPLRTPTDIALRRSSIRSLSSSSSSRRQRSVSRTPRSASSSSRRSFSSRRRAHDERRCGYEEFTRSSKLLISPRRLTRSVPSLLIRPALLMQ